MPISQNFTTTLIGASGFIYTTSSFLFYLTVLLCLKGNEIYLNRSHGTRTSILSLHKMWQKHFPLLFTMALYEQYIFDILEKQLQAKKLTLTNVREVSCGWLATSYALSYGC